MLKETLEEVFEDQYQQAITMKNMAQENNAQNTPEQPDQNLEKNQKITNRPLIFWI